jgi:cysteine desulfurase
MIYLDHAATTPLDPRVVEAMQPFFSARFYNPSSIYTPAKEVRRAVEWARETVAQILHARPTEIIFTAGGSESDNQAIKGVAFANRHRGDHIITSQVEHHAVLHTCEYLERAHGFRVTYLPVDCYGRVNPADLEAAIDERTILVTIMLANNEVGTIQPIPELARIARARGVYFHTDAVQGGGTLDLNVRRLGVDLLSLSGHKFYGPKGTGVLYVRRGTQIDPLIHGGSQEHDERAGTENVPGIVGLATALQLAYTDFQTKITHLKRLRDRLIEGVLSSCDGAMLTGHPTERLPNSASFCFEHVEGESVLLNLDVLGICASSGSACTAGSTETSHVLRAMGIPERWARGQLRLTVGHENTRDEIEYVLRELPPIVRQVRELATAGSPTTAAVGRA